MSPQKQIEFRELVLNLLSVIPEQDAHTLLDAQEKLERWVRSYADLCVSIAIQPYIKFDVKHLK